MVAASSAANDLYARLTRKNSSGSHPWVNRAVVLGLGIIAVLLVVDSQVKVYEYVLTYGWAILGASFGPQVVLILLWKRASYAGCVAGMLVGFATALLWKLCLDNEIWSIEVYNLTLAFVLALIVNVIFSLAIPNRPAGRDALAADDKGGS